MDLGPQLSFEGLVRADKDRVRAIAGRVRAPFWSQLLEHRVCRCGARKRGRRVGERSGSFSSRWQGALSGLAEGQTSFVSAVLFRGTEGDFRTKFCTGERDL